MRNRLLIFPFAIVALVFSASQPAVAWEHHPMFTRPVLSTMGEVTGRSPVVATSLESFLSVVESDLVTLLGDEETWARDHLSSYKARPDALAFQFTGTANDIRERFLRAIRLNPTIKTPLYVSPLAGTQAARKSSLAPSDVSILQDTSPLSVFSFEIVAEGDSVAPIDVVAAASNEPDYGMDIGLFEDNNTSFGLEYGFGVQPFGNPGLDFGSQAPFHMGFYHEASIVYLFASFLKECYPEARIHMFKSLSELAFSRGEDYWGWRFMGWGLHYLGDLSMPYHTSPLPGRSTFEMLLINLLDMLGWSTPKDNAVQISSNRHVALETFEGIVLNDALLSNDLDNPILSTLLAARSIPAYTDDMPRAAVSAAAHSQIKKLDRAIARYMPSSFVSDPSVELGDVPERYEIVDMVEADHGAGAVTALNELQAKAFAIFASYGRSYVNTILDTAR